MTSVSDGEEPLPARSERDGPASSPLCAPARARTEGRARGLVRLLVALRRVTLLPVAVVVGTVGLGLVPPGTPVAAATGTPEVQRVLTPARLPAAGIAGWPQGLGYWVATAAGGVFAVGGAQFYGSLAGKPVHAQLVGIAATPTGRGYWLVTADGGVYTFGTAHFYGSLTGQRLLDPVVGMAPTPDGEGYWLVAADGGVFSFGNARYWGSVPGNGVRITDAIGLVPTDTGKGYYVETPSKRYPFGTVYRDVPDAAEGAPAFSVVSAAAVFRGLCEVNPDGTVVVYHTRSVYHTPGTWSEQRVLPRPVAISSTAVSQNLFVLDAVGQVKVIAGPGPPPT